MSTHALEEILHPQSIAVVGASGDTTTQGYNFTHHLLEYGFKGRVYAVNPRHQEILGLKTYASLRDIPGPVDYVISCVPASAVLGMLEDCAHKGVKAVQLFTGRFAETGRREPAELEQAILRQARKAGIRLIGPNCMGVYYPKEGISCAYDLPMDSGSVGGASQTGGGAVILAQLGALRGLRFSKLISYGNALDFNECDYLDYFSHDPETKIIVMYIEGVRHGKRFFSALSQAALTKPVIVLKGGRGEAGTRAVASHTASLAGSMRIWETLVTQAGAISAGSMDEMIDLAISFYLLPSIPGPRVGLVGGGGGPSVLAADECEEAGLDVIPLPADIREEVKSRGVPIWDWVGNPADTSIMGGAGFTSNDMLRLMARNENFDLLIANIHEVSLSTKESTISRHREEVKQYVGIKKESSKPLMMVISDKSVGSEDYDNWRWKLTAEIRTSFVKANIPFYPTTRRAASAARKLIDYYQRRR